MSEHWYKKDGSPCYTQPNRSRPGEHRSTTIIDARRLGLYPSVTTIIAQLDKPGLNRWKEDQLLNTAFKEIKTGDSDEEILSWKSSVLRKSKRKGNDAAAVGSQIHDALEQYYSDNTFSSKFRKYVDPVKDSMHSRFGNLEWVPEKAFGCSLGFGGKVDLHFPNEDGIVLDFKTKTTAKFESVKPYIEHAMQLAAYRVGLGIPNATCYNVFISVNNPGDLFIHEWDADEIDRAWKMFSYLLNFWKVANRFED
jgi:hypothetical protein